MEVHPDIVEMENRASLYHDEKYVVVDDEDSCPLASELSRLYDENLDEFDDDDLY